MSLNFQLTVFSDPQGEAAARVYVVAVPDRNATADELASYRLSGQIIGPTCRYSSTLQTKIPFQHRGLTPCGDRTALLAEALVPDPCYWSTELPFLYRAVGEVAGAATDTTPFEQTFGIRSVGRVGNRLTFNGKVWVPRIVSSARVVSTPLEHWRATDTMMWGEFNDQLGRDAGELGILLMVDVVGKEGAAEKVFELSRYPAVVLVRIGDECRIDRKLQSAGRNLLLGRLNQRELTSFDDEAASMRLFLVLKQGDLVALDSAVATGLPLLAVRPTGGTQSLIAARSVCDQTQREIAPHFRDVAGYAVI